MKQPYYLTPHFTLQEATRTSQPLDNSPSSQEDLLRIRGTAEWMEVVRDLLNGSPILVNSWYRNEEVNKAVGGVANSQHRKGEAVDFRAPRFGSPRQIYNLLKSTHKEALPFDQLILYPTFVHISFRSDSKPPRRQAFTK